MYIPPKKVFWKTERSLIFRWTGPSFLPTINITKLFWLVLTWSDRHQISQRNGPTCAVSASASNPEAVKGPRTAALGPEWLSAAAWLRRKILEHWELLRLQGQWVQVFPTLSVVQHHPAWTEAQLEERRLWLPVFPHLVVPFCFSFASGSCLWSLPGLHFCPHLCWEHKSDTLRQVDSITTACLNVYEAHEKLTVVLCLHVCLHQGNILASKPAHWQITRALLNSTNRQTTRTEFKVLG